MHLQLVIILNSFWTQIRAVKVYHQRHRDSEEFKQKQRANSKKAYEKDKERIIARVRANQRRNQENRK